MSDVTNCKGNDLDVNKVKEETEGANRTSLIKRQCVPLGLNGETSSSSDHSIRIMQWNILAQGLCKCSDSFVLCPKEALEWSVRQDLIVQELLSYMPDILCLQEVDNFDFLQSSLIDSGYKGSFFPKPDSPCLYTSDNNGPDGCAIFWNTKRLSSVSINNYVLQKEGGKCTNQVAILCRFRLDSKNSDDNGHEFYVSTTHLKSKVGYHRLRHQQGQYLEELLKQQCVDAPLILCGDFNAEPQEKVISVFKNSALGLLSSYSLLFEDGSEPPYTTWKVRGNSLGKQEEFCHTIDYLFFTSEHFVCSQLVKLPTGEEIGEGRLPSYSYPSDHLSLIADLQLKI